jgi:hypothetical protein
MDSAASSASWVKRLSSVLCFFAGRIFLLPAAVRAVGLLVAEALQFCPLAVQALVVQEFIRMVFEAFIGVAPRQFTELFPIFGDRKTSDAPE